MKVMFDTSPGPFTSGGTYTYIQYLLPALHEISKIHNIEITEVFLPKWIYPSRKHWLTHKAKVIGWDSLYMHMMLPRRASMLNVDVLHTPAYRLPIQILTCTVTTIHDIIPFIFPELFRLRDRFVIRAYMRLAGRRANRIITSSEQSRQDIHTELLVPLDKIHVAHLGVSPNFRRADQRSILQVLSKYGISQPYILSVGTIEPRKNLARILQMFATLKHQRLIPHRLVLTGKPGWLDTPVYRLISQLKIENDIQFTGYVDDSHLPALYSGAAVFVYPSLYEGFGLPPLEAMSCGCPVVTSNSSSIPEVVGSAAVVVDPSNLLDLCEGVMSIVSDQEFAHALSDKGMRQAHLFTWHRCATQTINVYNQTINSPSVP